LARRQKIKLEGQKDYVQLLEDTVRQLDALIYDIESNTTQNVSGQPISTELMFDSVPVIRKLKDARRFAIESIEIYQ